MGCMKPVSKEKKEKLKVGEEAERRWGVQKEVTAFLGFKASFCKFETSLGCLRLGLKKCFTRPWEYRTPKTGKSSVVS